MIARLHNARMRDGDCLVTWMLESTGVIPEVMRWLSVLLPLRLVIRSRFPLVG